MTAGVLWFTLGPKKPAPSTAAKSASSLTIRVAPAGTGVRVLGSF